MVSAAPVIGSQPVSGPSIATQFFSLPDVGAVLPGNDHADAPISSFPGVEAFVSGNLPDATASANTPEDEIVAPSNSGVQAPDVDASNQEAPAIELLASIPEAFALSHPSIPMETLVRDNPVAESLDPIASSPDVVTLLPIEPDAAPLDSSTPTLAATLVPSILNIETPEKSEPDIEANIPDEETALPGATDVGAVDSHIPDAGAFLPSVSRIEASTPNAQGSESLPLNISSVDEPSQSAPDSETVDPTTPVAEPRSSANPNEGMADTNAPNAKALIPNVLEALAPSVPDVDTFVPSAPDVSAPGSAIPDHGAFVPSFSDIEMSIPPNAGESLANVSGIAGPTRSLPDALPTPTDSQAITSVPNATELIASAPDAEALAPAAEQQIPLNVETVDRSTPAEVTRVPNTTDAQSPMSNAPDAGSPISNVTLPVSSTPSVGSPASSVLTQIGSPPSK